MTETLKNVAVEAGTEKPGVMQFLVKEVAGDAVLLGASAKYEVGAQISPAPAAGALVQGRLVARGRKVWTIPAGGSFVSPLKGQPRVAQGRVLAVDGKMMVVQAGYPLCIEMPEGRSTMDLKNGPVVPGVMVNVTLWPGVKLEVA